jgi:FixJ family two-component response regulator
MTMTVSAPAIRVVDDDASWRRSITRLLAAAGYEVVPYESAEQFLQTDDFSTPGCILLDVRMPSLSGLQLQRSLAAQSHALPIVFLTGHGDIPMSVNAMRAGAEDFLTKPVTSEALLVAVQRALARDSASRAQEEEKRRLLSRLDTLTPTEHKVFVLIVRGRLNKQIAYELGSTERTIKWHRRNIMDKLKVDSLAEMVSFAEHLGVLVADDNVDAPAPTR